MKWKVEVPRGFKGHRNIVTSEGVKVATVWEDGDNTESTAHLIAAAPELLEALEYLCSITEQPPLKNCKCHINPPCSDCVDYGALREALEDATKAISKAKGA